MPWTWLKRRSKRAWPAAPRRPRSSGSAIRRSSAAASAGGVARRHQQAGLVGADQLGDRRDRGRDTGQALALRLHQDVGQAVAIAVAGDPAGQDEQIGCAVMLQHHRMWLGAEPGDALGQAERRGLTRQPRALGAVPDMHQPPMQPRRQQRERAQQVGIAFLVDQPADRQHDRGVARILAAAGWARDPRRAAEAVEVEAVIGQADSARLRCERAQMCRAGCGAGDQPAAVGELLGLVPIGRRPDILGVRRDRPGQSGQQRGIARDRGRRVEEMGMQLPDPTGQLVGEHERLAEPADAVARAIAAQVAPPGGPRRAITRPAAQRAPGGEQLARRLVEIFRQINHRRRDLVMDRMGRAVGRTPQRDDEERQAALLERANLLGNEGLGQPRIAFEHECRGRGFGGQGCRRRVLDPGHARRLHSRPRAPSLRSAAAASAAMTGAAWRPNQ